MDGQDIEKEGERGTYTHIHTYISHTRLFDKRDDFNFPIVNVPFLSSNIPSEPAYRVYVSQLIRYARACTKYPDFVERGKLLITCCSRDIKKVYSIN